MLHKVDPKFDAFRRKQNFPRSFHWIDIDGGADGGRGPTWHRPAGIDRVRALEEKTRRTRDESDRRRFRWRAHAGAVEEKRESGCSLHTRARPRRDGEGWSLRVVPARSVNRINRAFPLRPDAQTDSSDVAGNRHARFRSARYRLPQLHLRQHDGKMYGSGGGEPDRVRGAGSTQPPWRFAGGRSLGRAALDFFRGSISGPLCARHDL